MAARPTPGLRGRREGSRTFNPATPGARRPKRPLLEGQTPALCIEPDDPEVPVGLAHRFAVADLQARHASVTLDRHDLAIHGEDFLGSFAFRLPHGGDGRQTLEGLLKGGRSGRSPRVRTARRAPRCPAFATLARTAQPTPAPQHGPSCDPITGPVASTWQRF